jgi:hypothetical protein
MTRTTDPEQFAETLRTAYAQGIDQGLAAAAPFVGAIVALDHAPPQASDGPKPGPELAAMWEQEGAMLRTSLPDAQITDLVITPGDGEVKLQAVVRGTSNTGSAVAHPYTVIYGLADGKVVRASAAYDHAPIAAQAFEGTSPP